MLGVRGKLPDIRQGSTVGKTSFAAELVVCQEVTDSREETAMLEALRSSHGKVVVKTAEGFR